MIEQLLIGLLLATLISLLSYFAKLLTLSGSIAQLLLGTILIGLGGWQWTVPMVVFFLLSSLISRIGKDQRVKAESFFEKSSRRDARQVVANGGVAGLVTLVWFFTRLDVLYVAYLGSIAAATADTWGTEIGTLSHSPPILISTLKKVEAGRSGAVTPLGLLSGILGSFTIWLSALPWLTTSVQALFFSVLAGGIAGTLADSLAGATIQLQYECSVCGKATERVTHCSHASRQASGLSWLRNDEVNLICTIVGACASLLIFLSLA